MKKQTPSTLLSQLQAGIPLENLGITIPWGKTNNHLIKTCRPTRTAKTVAWNELHWDGVVVLDGLPAIDLEANLAPHCKFEDAWIWLERGYSDAEAVKTFRRALSHLRTRFGEPQSPLPTEYETYDKLIIWELDGINIALSLRLGPEFADYNYCCQIILHRQLNKK